MTLHRRRTPPRPVRLTALEQQVLTELRQAASDTADVVEADLAAAAAAVGLELVGTGSRLKSLESLSRKYADETRLDPSLPRTSRPASTTSSASPY